MKKSIGLHGWMVKNLEEPLFQAEIYKTKLQKCTNNDNCSHNLIAISMALVMPLIIVAASML